MSGFEMQRLGILMEPEPGNPQEIEGVLNPAAARGPDGELYLFPRLVAQGNYSRIGISRVRFSEAGDPIGVERLGIALEPEADYERRPDAGVIVILSLICQMLADAAFLPSPLLWAVRIGVPLSAILISSGFFFSLLPPTATQPGGAVALIYVGAVILALSVITLGVGLLRSQPN